MTKKDASADRPFARELEYLSPGALKQMARALDLPVKGNERADLVAALAPAIGSARHRLALERSLTPDEWALLTLLPLRTGAVRLRVILGVLRQRGMEAKAAVAVAAKLLQSACLLPVDISFSGAKLNLDAGGLGVGAQHAWFELVPAVEAWAREHVPAAPPKPPAAPPPAVAPADLLSLQRTAFVVLAELGRTPLRLTAAGVPHKVDLSRLAKTLNAATGAGPVKGSPEAPPLLWFTLAALTGAEVVAVEQDVLTAPGAGEFLHLPAEDQVRRLFKGWLLGQYDDVARIPTLSTSYYTVSGSPTYWIPPHGSGAGYRTAARLSLARQGLMAAISEAAAAAPGGWLTLDRLSGLLYEECPEFLFERWEDYELYTTTAYGYGYGATRHQRVYPGLYRMQHRPGSPRNTVYTDIPIKDGWAEVEGAFLRQVAAEPLRWLGLVDVGPSVEAPDRFRLTELGQRILALPAAGAPAAVAAPAAAAPAAAGRVVVQPNYDVIVMDALGSLGLMAQLDQFADRRTLDRAATYRLTQTALVSGLDRGWTGERIIATLESATGKPLPQNVRFSIEEWVRAYERLWLREAATLLEADTPQQLDGWLADPALSLLLGSRLGPATVLVPARQAAALTQQLAKQGVPLPAVDYNQPMLKVLRVRDPDLIEVERERLDPYLQYRIEMFAERAGETPKLVRFRITRQTVQAAVAAGWKDTQIGAFLAQAAGKPTPVDISARIIGWSGVVGPLAAETVMAVALPLHPVAGALRQIPEIVKHIRAMLTPTIALVAPASLPALRAALEERGLSVVEQPLPDEALRAAIPAAAMPSLDQIALQLAPALLQGLTPEDLDDLEAELRMLGTLPRKERPRRSP